MKGMLLRRQLNASVRATTLVPAPALALALALALAGCSSDTTDTETTAPSDVATSTVPDTATSTPMTESTPSAAPTTAAPTTAASTEASEPVTAPTPSPAAAEPTATAVPVPDGWNVVTSTDGSFTAAVPARYVDARKLMEAEDLSATLDDLGVELDAGEATDMLGQMSMDQVPWFVFDRETLSSGFSDNLNILPAGATGDVTAEQVMQQLEAAGASFGEIPLGPREVTTVGPYEAVQYDYELPINGSTVRGRQLFVLADQLYVASQTSTGERFNENLLAKVAATIRPT